MLRRAGRKTNTGRNHGSDKGRLGSDGQTGPVAVRPFLVDFLAFIHAWLILEATYPLFASATGLSGGKWWAFNLYGLTILGAVILSFYLIRMIRKLFLFHIIAVIYIAAVGYGASELGENMNTYSQAILVALSGIYIMVVFAFRLSARMNQSRLQQDFVSQHEGEENMFLESWETPTFLSVPRPIQWIWPTLFYLPAVMASYKDAYCLMFGMLALDVLVMFLFNYMDGFHAYIRDHYKVANMPIVMMRKVHRMLMVTAVGLIAAAILPAVCYHTEPLDGVHPDLVIELPQQQDDMMAEENYGDNSMEWINQLSEEDSWVPPEWLITLFRILMYLFLAIAIIGMVWAFWKRFRENSMDYAQEDEDEVIFLDQVAKENAEQLYGGKKKTESFFSPNAQIRRRFRKAIQKGTVGKPQKWETPKELENSAKWKKTEDEQVLHELYEKARYSQKGCDKEDLGKLKG